MMKTHHVQVRYAVMNYNFSNLGCLGVSDGGESRHTFGMKKKHDVLKFYPKNGSRSVEVAPEYQGKLQRQFPLPTPSFRLGLKSIISGEEKLGGTFVPR